MRRPSADRWSTLWARGRTRCVWLQGVVLIGIVGMGLLVPTISEWLDNGWTGVATLRTGSRLWSVFPIRLPISSIAGYIFGRYVWSMVEREHRVASSVTLQGEEVP